MPSTCVYILGGLGNQLFQVAALLAHCVKQKKSCAIYQDKWSEYNNTWLHAFAHCYISCEAFQQLKQRGFYDKQHSYMIPFPDDSSVVRGFFQSARYFEEIQPLIRQVFQLPLPMQASIESKHRNLLTPDLLARGIVVHVRRGDYLRAANFHGVLSAKYFESAIARARSLLEHDAPLILFSDDVPWCKEQLAFSEAFFVDEPLDYASLFLMTRFRRFVISNSSFSWWGVFLSNEPQLVIAPDRWFGPEGFQDFQDIYCRDWILHPIDYQ